MEQRQFVVKKETKPNRVRYIDSGRSLASFAGIIYHVALIFSAAWIISAGEQNQIPELKAYTQYINLFRMPLFLFISGYFSMSVLSRKGTKRFLDNRVKRIGIPLLSTMILLNSLQSYIGNYLLYGRHTFDGWISQLLPWSSNFSLSHAWYLYYILVFSLVLLVVDYKKIVTSRIQKLCNYNVYLIDVFFILLTIGISCVGLAIYKIVPLSHELMDIIDMAIYLPYFLIGYVCYVSKDLLERLIINVDKKRAFYFCAMIILSMAILLLLPDSAKYPKFFMNLVCRYYSLFIVIYLLKRFLNKENKVIHYMSNSSYGVYILHQPVIVLVGCVYLKYFSDVPKYVAFISVLSASIILTYLLEWAIIRKTKIGKLLFNGA